MSKFDALWLFLKNSSEDNLRLTFNEIADISGSELDHSFLNYKKEAASYGWKVGKISIKEQNIFFERVKQQ